MARLNTSIGHSEDADKEVISGSPHSKAENFNEEDEEDEEDEADGADMSALINYASGKKTPPATPASSSHPLGVIQKLFGSLRSHIPTGQSSSVLDNAPLEEHILTPKNAKASGPDDTSRSDPAPVPITGGKSLIRPSNIHYDMSVRTRPDIYDIPEEEPAPKTRHSSRRQGRDSEGDDNASSHDEATEPQDKTVPATRSRGRPRKSVVSSSTKSQEKPVQAKRARGRPAKAKVDAAQVPRVSKRKAQDDSGEKEDDGQIEVPVEKPANYTAMPTRSSKRQKVDAMSANTASATQANPQATRNKTTSKSVQQPPELGDEDGLRAAPAESTRSKQQDQSAQQSQRTLREESPELDAPHDEGVDSILRSPTPEAQDQPTASRPGVATGSHRVHKGQEDRQNLDADEDEEDYESGAEGEAEDENLQEPEKGPITNADIKLMREFMRKVGAGIKDGELTQQDKPEIATEMGKRISKLTSKAILKHKDVIQKAKDEENGGEAIKNARASINKYLKTIETLVANILDSNLFESKMHALRFKMMTDLYAYNIPDLVELVSISFKSYKHDKTELETPDIIEIKTILGHLIDLCNITRDQPKNLQPKIPSCQLAGPTRRLCPVVRDLVRKCAEELIKREEEEKAARWRAEAPERELERQRKRAAEEAERQASAAASRSQINPHSSAPRPFTQPFRHVMPEEELTDIQRAAKAERLAYDTAEKAKKADRNARRLAKEADANIFDNHLAAKAEAAKQSARSALNMAIEAENKMVELATLINLKPGPSYIDSLRNRSGSVRLELDSTVQTLGRHNLHVPVASEWNDQELMIMVNGLQSIPGNEKYTMIEEYLPHRSRQEILDKAKEFQRDQIEAWHEIRKRNPSCKPLPQWIYRISRDS